MNLLEEEIERFEKNESRLRAVSLPLSLSPSLFYSLNY